MKKILIISIAILAVGTVSAQTDSRSASKNSNAAEPLVNGIPYSQYKAQQEALKKQQELKDKQAIAKVQQELSFDIKDAKQAPAVKQVAPAVTNAKKTEPTPVVVPSPATQTIPAQTLKISPATEKPVPAVAVKPTVENSKANTESVLIAMPTLSTASDKGAVDAKAAPVSQAVQVQGQAKAAVVVETAPSVASPTPKSPKQN